MKLATITTFLAFAALCSCDPTTERPPSTSSSSTATEGGSTTGCVPHLVLVTGSAFGCMCDLLLVEPELCGCSLDNDACSCPSYPCAEVTCDGPCELGDAFCECGSLRAPVDYPACS